MKTAMKHIHQAFGFLSQMTVNDGNVDLLALARQELRVAYGQLEGLVKEGEEKAEKTEEVKEDVGNPAEDAEQ